MKKILPLLLIFSLTFNVVQSQEVREVNLNTRVNQAVLIVEGKVISKRSFWDNNLNNIYTASKVEVYKVFKGNVTTSFIEVITPGGVVGMQKEEVHPSLELNSNDVGIFMLKNNTITTTNVPTLPKYEPYASVQGFIEYDLLQNTAASAFDSYNNIDIVLYNTISGITNTSFSVIKPFSVKQVTTTNKATPVISNFSPTTVTAGTATQLTINGSNFGSTAGSVGFADANDGGSTFYTALNTQIVSWSNTQIIVEVPDRAGTGNIRVTNTDPASATSAATLTVSYAELNVESDAVSSGIDVAYSTQHVDDNSSGGYTWQMFTDFNNDANANAAFVRAFNSWASCSGTQINWTIGSVTTTDAVASDGINIVRHDNGGELPNGVLGRCTSRYNGCFNGPTLNWFVSELDIVFDDGTNWNYSTSAPGFTEYDFESVAVHELGHGHQLGHVINTNDVMHYAISNGEQQRTPSVNNLAAGNDVMSRSTTTAVCGNGLMTALSCGSAPVADFSGTPTTLCEGNTVTFTDLSTNSPTSWSWSFPGGTPSTSNSQNPTVTYSLAGTYNVTLTATNASGNDGETKTGYITVNGTPGNAGTITGSNSVCQNATGIGYSIAAVSGATSYTWTVPSGASITNGQGTTSITVSFGTSSGNVSVTPSNTCGNGGSNNLAVTVNTCAGAPVANFSGTPTSLCEGSTVSFTDLSTNSPTSWSWSFPGGTPSTSNSQNPTVTYNSAGTYAVTLTATNASGSDPETKTGYITVSSSNSTFLDTTELIAPHCGITLSSATSLIYANSISGATNYQFRITNSSLGFSHETHWSNGRWLNIMNIPGIQLNTTYDVEVRVRTGACDINSYYGSACQVTTSGNPVPNTSVIPNLCGTTISTTTPIYAKPVAGATHYTFEISNASLGFSRTVTITWRYIQFYWWGVQLQPNTPYDIRVRATVNGVVGNYSTSCQITTPSTLRLANEELDPELPILDQIVEEPKLEMVVYPNPSQGEFFYMDVEGLQENSELLVTDVSGKVVHQQKLSGENSNSTIRFNEKLNSGFYVITLVSGTQKVSKKLIVR